jgi:soluble lytic murein transglycosylase
MKKNKYKSQMLFVVLSLILCVQSFNAQTYNDATLNKVREQDKTNRDSNGKLLTLNAVEHNYRADVYASNRVFSEAREHWDKILKVFPTDPLAGKAFFGIGRSYMWEREYGLAITFFDDAIKNFSFTKEGREALAFKGACLVRLGRSDEAAKVYEQYTAMFPTGERIESSYLNVIDALREAGKFDQANIWVNKTRQQFPGTATSTNAIFARLRMEIGRKKWNEALLAADDLRLQKFPKGSMTNLEETNFLRGYILEKLNRNDEAIAAYSSLPATYASYYGGLATDRLAVILNQNSTSKIKVTVYSESTARSMILERQTKSRASAVSSLSQYPALYQKELMRYARVRNVDPRLILAIMKQESSFRENVKSPSAARGLLQMTIDTAAKYKVQAGFPNLQAEDLYRPDVSIALGSAYLAELQKQFGTLSEAVVASYNGGEDNAARWVKRANSKDTFVFTAEVGFAETKEYVFKVMSNYRVYKELYSEDLKRK